ncbi:MAG TPA: glutamyl-tRNA reductase [Candidatus Acidoferrales bacterium]|nr:glutamyl-tRNA reductase [Candidatus Acidoferrales bacterium]
MPTDRIENSASNRAESGAPGRVEVALIGCNHVSAPVELRERVAFTPEQALEAASELRRSGIIEEAVVVSTCNRSELYGVSAESSEGLPQALMSYFGEFHKIALDELDGRVYQHVGRQAARHLFRVASGLDSMLLGEAEILGQVREAYNRALGNGSTGPVLNRLFQGALEVGKRVRSETEIGSRPMSVAFAGVKLAERIFGDLKKRRAVIVGAGAVAEQVVEHLRLRGIGELRVVNRSFARAQELALRMGGVAAEWAALEKSLEQPDILVTSVSGNEPVLTRAMLERAMLARAGRAVCVIDLGVPRNVEAQAEGIYNAYLFNIDHLGEIVEQNRKARESEIPRADAIVDEHVEKFLAWQTSLEGAGLVEALRARLNAEGEALLAAHAAEANGAGNALAERQHLERVTRELIDRIVQLPEKRLREQRKLRRPVEGLAALRELFGLDDAGDKEKR